MIYSVLTSHRDGSFRHILDATGDATDQNELMDKAEAMVRGKYGGLMAITCINNHHSKGYQATMAKCTHDMWGKEIA